MIAAGEKQVSEGRPADPEAGIPSARLHRDQDGTIRDCSPDSLRVDVTEIVMHEAYEPDALVDPTDAEA
jgi:hypothetical protein